MKPECTLETLARLMGGTVTAEAQAVFDEQLAFTADYNFRHGIETERERCAQVCERTHKELDAEFSPEGCTDSALVAADRIREGGGV